MDPTEMEDTSSAKNKTKRLARKDTITEPEAKKQKTTKCHLLQTVNLPYNVIFETKPIITGVYKIAYDQKTIFVSKPSSNVINELRKHFTKRGNNDIYNFMTTLSEEQKQKLTVFWLDETLHEHKCGTSYLKCIEALQASKPRFNTRKVTNENRDSGSRDSYNIFSLPPSSISFQNNDQNADDGMIEIVEAKTPPKRNSSEEDTNKTSSLSETARRRKPMPGPTHQWTRPMYSANPLHSDQQWTSAQSTTFVQYSEPRFRRTEQGNAPPTCQGFVAPSPCSRNIPTAQHRNEGTPSGTKDKKEGSFRIALVVGCLVGLIVGCIACWIVSVYVFMVVSLLSNPSFGLLVALLAGCSVGCLAGSFVGILVGSFVAFPFEFLLGVNVFLVVAPMFGWVFGLLAAFLTGCSVGSLDKALVALRWEFLIGFFLICLAVCIQTFGVSFALLCIFILILWIAGD